MQSNSKHCGKVVVRKHGHMTLHEGVLLATSILEGDVEDGTLLYSQGCVEHLLDTLEDCISSLEYEFINNYHGQDPDEMHPVTRRDYDLDMEEIKSYKDVLKQFQGEGN